MASRNAGRNTRHPYYRQYTRRTSLRDDITWSAKCVAVGLIASPIVQFVVWPFIQALGS